MLEVIADAAVRPDLESPANSPLTVTVTRLADSRLSAEASTARLGAG